MRPTEALLRSAELITGDWQVHVYLYAKRVLKIPKALDEIEEAITGGALVSEVRRREVPGQARQVRQAYFDGLRTVQQLAVPPALLGHPEFADEGVYWQDRVAIVGDILRQYDGREDDAEAASLLERFAQFNCLLWAHGVYEVTYNFTSNVGVDGDGNFILVDFGELATDRNWIINELVNKRWERSWSYRRDMPMRFRATYAAIANRVFTAENFDQCWPTAAPAQGGVSQACIGHGRNGQ